MSESPDLELCLRCGQRAVCDADDYGEHCSECLQTVNENRAEAAYERSLEECFRGDEAMAFLASQQEQARRLK